MKDCFDMQENLISQKKHELESWSNPYNTGTTKVKIACDYVEKQFCFKRQAFDRALEAFSDTIYLKKNPTTWVIYALATQTGSEKRTNI